MPRWQHGFPTSGIQLENAILDDHRVHLQLLGNSAYLTMNTSSPSSNSNVIRMAWQDRISFEAIEEKTGLSEKEVIRLMRRELKPSSFRLWRKRVSGRTTKHRKLWKYRRRTGRD